MAPPGHEKLATTSPSCLGVAVGGTQIGKRFYLIPQVMTQSQTQLGGNTHIMQHGCEDSLKGLIVV